MPPLEHKGYGIHAELVDFSQAQFETYQPLILGVMRDSFFQLESNGRGLNASSMVNRVTVQAAIKAGFLKGITEEQIGAMSPAAVAWLTKKIRKHVDEVVTPKDDPN